MNIYIGSIAGNDLLSQLRCRIQDIVDHRIPCDPADLRMKLLIQDLHGLSHPSELSSCARMERRSNASFSVHFPAARRAASCSSAERSSCTCCNMACYSAERRASGAEPLIHILGNIVSSTADRCDNSPRSSSARRTSRTAGPKAPVILP